MEEEGEQGRRGHLVPDQKYSAAEIAQGHKCKIGHFGMIATGLLIELGLYILCEYTLHPQYIVTVCSVVRICYLGDWSWWSPWAFCSLYIKYRHTQNIYVAKLKCYIVPYFYTFGTLGQERYKKVTIKEE